MSGLGHSPVGASGAKRRIQCPASVTMQARYPEVEQSPEAADGEAAHWALAQMNLGVPVHPGTQAPNGVLLTDDMIDGALECHEDIRGMLAPFGMAPSQGATEVTLPNPRIHEAAWGTPDYFAWLPTRPRPTLLLYDFKFGFRYVEVFENQQLAEYVAAVVSTTRLADLDIDVIAKIAQPRCYHQDGTIREWRFNAADIRGLINIGAHAAAEALGPDPKARSGSECRDCTARHSCTVFQREFQGALTEVGRTLPMELPPAALAVEHWIADRAIEVLTARRDALAIQALAVAKSGRSVPGYRLEYGQGRQRWKIPPEAVIGIARQLEVNIAKPVEPFTPKQALAAGMPASLVAQFSETPRTAAKLVVDDGSAARAVFSQRGAT